MSAPRYRINVFCVLLVALTVLVMGCGPAAPTGAPPTRQPTAAPRSATVTPPPTQEPAPTPPLAGLSPREVAETHYDAVARDDWDVYVATLSADNQATAATNGGTAQVWWQTARRYATEYGVTYRFLRGDREEAAYQKLFFDRLNADGSPRGSPVPIHMTLEKDGWRVQTASY